MADVTRTTGLCLALLLGLGTHGPARAQDYLRRLQPSQLPPLPTRTIPVAPPSRRPLRTPPLPSMAPIQPAPEVTVTSPYGSGRRRLVEPQGEVTDVAVHPNGRWLAAASSDRHVHVWDLQAETHVALPLPGGAGQHVRFSPDGRWLAATGIQVSSGVTLMSMGPGGPERPFQLGQGGGFDEQVAFSPDGKRLIVDGYEKLMVYDLPATGRPSRQPDLEVPSATTSYVRAEFSPDGKHLVVANHDGKVQSWRTDTWERLGVWDVPQAEYSAGRPHGLVMTPGTSEVWLVTPDQLIALDYTTGAWGKAYHDLEGYTLARRPGGRTMAIGKLDGSTVLVDPASGAEVLRLEGHREDVEGAAFFPDGRLVTGSEDGTVVIWELLPESELVGKGPGGPLPRVQYPFRSTVPRRGQDSPRLAVSDLPEDPVKESTDGVSASFSPDGSLLASGYSGKLRIHRAGTREPFLDIDRLSGKGHVTAWLPGGDRVATIDREYVRIYSVPDGTERAAWSQPGGWHHHLSASPDGTRLARAGSREVAVHELATGKVVAGFEAMGKVDAVSSARLHDLDYSPDGTKLVTGGDDGALRLWHIDSHRLLAEVEGSHGASVRAARFLPDGKVISLGQDGIVRWWDPSLAPLRSEGGHLGEGRSLAVYPQRSLVLSGGRDGAVIFWGFDGSKKLRLDTELEAIDYLAPSPTGEWLVVASEADGSLRFRLPLLLTQLAR